MYEILIRINDKVMLSKIAALNSDVALYPHQERAVKKIVRNRNTILAHSVGAGKTLTTIAGFEALKKKGKAQHALVVVPASLRDNYAYQGIKRFTDSSFNIVGNKQEINDKRLPHSAPDPNVDYNIISYEMFRKDPEGYIKASNSDTVILDELHRIKNPTLTYKSIKQSRDLYRNFIGGTGSIVSNKVADAITLMDAARGGDRNTLNQSINKFERKYISRENSPMHKFISPKKRPIAGFRNREHLKDELNKYIDYVGYEDIKESAKMPNKLLKEVKVPITKEQADAWIRLVEGDEQLKSLITNRRFEYLDDFEASKLFSSMIEARKLMNDVGTIKPGEKITDTVEETPKTKALLDDVAAHLKNTPDGGAILSSFLIRGGTESLEAGLQNRGINYGLFTGKGKAMTEEKRQQAVEDFNNRDVKAIIISGAGGEGLSLNNATKVNVLDIHYNPERTNQIEARGIRSGGLAHRLPEDRNVLVNRYIATMPKKKFWGIEYEDRLLTPDELIKAIADKKDKQNAMFRSVLREMMEDRHGNRKGQ